MFRLRRRDRMFRLMNGVDFLALWWYDKVIIKFKELMHNDKTQRD